MGLLWSERFTSSHIRASFSQCILHLLHIQFLLCAVMPVFVCLAAAATGPSRTSNSGGFQPGVSVIWQMSFSFGSSQKGSCGLRGVSVHGSTSQDRLYHLDFLRGFRPFVRAFTLVLCLQNNSESSRDLAKCFTVQTKQCCIFLLARNASCIGQHRLAEIDTDLKTLLPPNRRSARCTWAGASVRASLLVSDMML